MHSRSGDNCGELFAIADPAIIFPPIHFRRIGREIGTGDMMVRPDFRATQAGEKAFRHVGAGIVRAIRLAVIDPLRIVPAVKLIPMSGIVGIDGAARGDALVQGRDSGGF